MKLIGSTEDGDVLVKMTVEEWQRWGWPGYREFGESFNERLFLLANKANKAATARMFHALRQILVYNREKDFGVFRMEHGWPTWREWVESVLSGAKDVQILAVRNVGRRGLDIIKETLAATQEESLT